MIPQSPTLATRQLSRVFDSTTATYKFYWFLGLLHAQVASGLVSVRAIDLAARMVAMAWDATLVHRLSFGWADQLPKVAQWMVATGRLQKNMAEEDIAENLSGLARTDAEVRKSLQLLLTHVPYRFLSP